MFKTVQMKTFLFTLVLLISFFSVSQKKDTQDSISKFILDIENSIVESINEHRTKNNIITVNRESVLDSASNYHNEYLKILNGDNSKSFYISHVEVKYVDQLYYNGNKDILKHSDERVLKFDEGGKFYNEYEIIFAIGGLSRIINNPDRSSKIISNYVLNAWLNSKGHKSVVEDRNLDRIGVSVYFNTESNSLCVVSVLSNKK
jgi:uncharacterized protein YkwD